MESRALHGQTLESPELAAGHGQGGPGTVIDALHRHDELVDVMNLRIGTMLSQVDLIDPS